jgi:LDH2 family malate/lactate/ureidoglycolate dehydrogenase
VNREPSDGIPVAAEALRGLVRALAERAGVREAQAALLADLLVGNDLRGVFSHGSRQVATYARLLRAGRLNPLCWLPSPSVAWCDGTGWSRCPAIVMVQAAQDRDGHDGGGRARARRWSRRTRDRLPEPLVRSRRVVVRTVLA